MPGNVIAVLSRDQKSNRITEKGKQTKALNSSRSVALWMLGAAPVPLWEKQRAELEKMGAEYQG